MRNLLAKGFLVTVLVIVSVAAALPASTAEQTLSYQIEAINEIAVSDSPASLVINTVTTVGSEPESVTDDTTTYAITTNGGINSRKITAQLDSDMPVGLTLYITLDAPDGADTTISDVILSMAPTDVVTCINSVAQSGLTITYTLSATVGLGVVNPAIRTVTLIITAS